MDKYEYKLKTEQMLELMDNGAYDKASEIADSIDWRRVRNATMLTNVSDIYEKTGKYKKSYEVLNIAYSRAEGSRKVIYRLCALALKIGNVDEAIDYYDDYIQIAPKDPNQHILRYKILRARRAPIGEQIDALEEFKKAEYIEEWAYELAKRYQEAGMTTECLEECDDLILWFSEGRFVYKAMELKMKYKPLTQSQQEKYDRRNNKAKGATAKLPENLARYKKPEEPQQEDVEEEVAAQIQQSEAKINEKKKSKLGNTMKLEDALHSLLHFGESNKVEDDETEEDKIENHEAEDDAEDMPEILTDEESAAEDVVEDVAPEDVEIEDAEPEDAEIEDTEPEDADIEDVVEVEYGEEAETPEEDEVPGGMAEEFNPDEVLASLGGTEDGQEEPEEEEPEEEEPEEEEPDMSDLEAKIEQIESVVDLDLINQLVDAKKEEKPEKSIEEGEEPVEESEKGEEEAEPEGEAPEEGEAEVKPEEPELEEAAQAEAQPESEEAEGESEESDVESAEPEPAEAKPEPAEAELESEPEEYDTDAESNSAQDDDQIEGQLSIDDILQGWSTQEEKPVEEESMKEKKKVEPILPPDIQQMIDEIEGVIPAAAEDKVPEAKAKPRRAPEKPRENMGRVTEQFRIDDESEEFEDFDDELDEDEVLDGDGEELDDDYAEEYEEDYEEDYEDESTEEYEDDDEAIDEEIEEEDQEEYEDDFPEEIDDEDEYEDEYAEDYEDDDAADYEDELDGAEELDDEYESEYEEFEEPFEDKDYAGSVAAEIEREFTPNLDQDEYDDREIPDEEEIDILSATTPLSRKETAKMIATGKTAPLPVNEISDALSLSDTGFVVHGRYDLEMQSGVGTRAGLTDDQKKLFSYFVPVRGMSEQLVDVLEQDKNCTNRRESSCTGNLLIIGNKGNGKTVLAVDVVKAIQKQRNIRQGKVAIVTGDALNKKKISDIFSKLYGGALIVEKAGSLNEKTVARMNKAMERDTGEMLIVLEEQRKPLDRLLSSNREFRRKFTSRLEVPIFINDELVTFGQTYAQENGYRIDEMGILALYSRIDALQREDHSVTVAEVKEVLDEAMQHSQKTSAKKLVKRVFGKNTDDADRIILSEKDFNI